jgi:cell division protein ZapA (FtsZ GTPase activity inhibitor)
MSNSEPVTSVRILGEEYKIRGASPDRITTLADYVDHKFRQIEQVKDLRRQAVLVSLHIAEEMFAERDRQNEREGKVSARLRSLRIQLERMHSPTA